MNKRDYLNKLLALCTEKQKDLFKRMYPEGPLPKQLDWATIQLENTLKDLNEQKEMMKSLRDQYNLEVLNLKKEADFSALALVTTQRELDKANKRIEQLSNPMSMANADIQTDLQILSALQAHGVDNWEGYDDAMRSARGFDETD